MNALRAVLGSRYAGVAVVLLAGLAACQGVELGVGVKPAVPPPDPAVVRQVEEARTAVAAAEERAKEATRLAEEAEAARASTAASVTDLKRRVAAGEATQEDLDRARRRAAEAVAEATQARSAPIVPAPGLTTSPGAWPRPTTASRRPSRPGATQRAPGSKSRARRTPRRGA